MLQAGTLHNIITQFRKLFQPNYQTKESFTVKGKKIDAYAHLTNLSHRSMTMKCNYIHDDHIHFI